MSTLLQRQHPRAAWRARDFAKELAIARGHRARHVKLLDGETSADAIGRYNAVIEACDLEIRQIQADAKAASAEQDALDENQAAIDALAEVDEPEDAEA